MPRYQWASAAEWLHDKINETSDRNELRSIARELLGHVDNDLIQDSFESDMDRDGFFDDLDKTETEDNE